MSRLGRRQSRRTVVIAAFLLMLLAFGAAFAASLGGSSQELLGFHKGSVSVPKNSPTLSTTPTQTTASTNAAITASATLASATSNAAGSITFEIFGPGAAPTDCTTGGTQVGTTVTVSGNGAYNTSTSFTPTQAGNYWWYASYSGDTLNSPATGPCGDTSDKVVVSTGTAATVTPTSGHVGDSVTLSGSNLPDSTTFQATYDGGGLILSGTTTTNGTGNIPAGVTFTVPPSTAGSHIVRVIAGASTAIATFTVTPSISLSLTRAGASTVVTVSGLGFAPSAGITLKFNSVNQSLTPTANSDTVGSFSGPTFAVPAITAGTYPVVANDGANTSNSINFTLTSAALAMDTTGSGAVHTTAKTSGSGFGASSTVTLSFDGTPITTASANGGGTFAGTHDASWTVPCAVPGVHTLNGADGTNSTNLSFTVTSSAVLTLGTTSAAPGTTVTVTAGGSGFNASTPYTLWLINQGFNPTTSGGTSLTTFTTTAGGAVPSSVSFTVPAKSWGPYSIVATDTTSSATCKPSNVVTFTIATPSISLSPSSAVHATTPSVTVAGGGFRGGGTIVSSTFDGTSVTPSSTAILAGGTFSVTFTVPASQVAGQHLVVFKDNSGTLAATIFTMT